MFDGRRTVVDPSLGQSVVFGGSRLTIGGLLGVGCLMLGLDLWLATGAGGSGTVDPAYYFLNSAAALACGLAVIWTSRLQLVIGTSGFRSVTPLRATELSWREVSAIVVEHPGRRSEHLIVSLSSRQMNLSTTFGFTAKSTEICDLMTERLEAFAGGDPERLRSSFGQAQAHEQQPAGPLDWPRE